MLGMMRYVIHVAVLECDQCDYHLVVHFGDGHADVPENISYKCPKCAEQENAPGGRKP